ncbi:MAG: kelch repeat-containing protein [Candidatus Thermoplasmatota archaeon]
MIVSAVALVLTVTALSVTAPSTSASPAWSWTDEPAMGAARYQATVVGAPDGTVYVMGGYSAVGILTNAVNSYDPEDGTWTALAAMPGTVRGAAGAMGLDGNVYAFGGHGPNDFTQIYDPVADMWTLGATMPYATWEAKAATLANGSIAVVGGYGAAGLMQIYDPVGNAWSLGPSVPGAVTCGGMVSVGDDLYYSGGCDGAWFDAMTWMYKYDSASGAWGALADLPEPIAGHAMVVGVDGLMYVVGGSDNGYNEGNGYAFDTVLVYDPEADEWDYAASMDYERTYLGATVTPDGRIMALGGTDGTSALSVVESLQLYTFEYTVELSSPTVRAGESVLLTVDGVYDYIEESSNELRWALISAADDTMYASEYVWCSTPAPIADSIDVSAAVPAGDYLVVIVYWYAYADIVYEYLEGITVELEVLPAAEPADVLIAELEAQIADLQAQIDDLSDDLNTTETDLMAEISVLQTQVTALEDALAALETSSSEDSAALMDEVAALQDEVAALKDALNETASDVGDVQTSVDDKLSATMGYAIIGLLVVVVILLIVMMVMGRKSPPPPAP